MDFYRIFASSYRLTNIFSSKNIKKILLFVLIGVILFLVFSNNVFASEETVAVSTLNNANIDSNGEIVSLDDHTIGYFEIEPNYQYTISNNQGGNYKRFGFSDIVPSIGVITSDYAVLEPGSSFSFSKLTKSYVYFDISRFEDGTVSITREYIGGYDYVSQDLANTLSVENLWNQLGFAIPLIGVAVLFALGFFVVRKLTKGESKAKLKF